MLLNLLKKNKGNRSCLRPIYYVKLEEFFDVCKTKYDIMNLKKKFLFSKLRNFGSLFQCRCFF